MAMTVVFIAVALVLGGAFAWWRTANRLRRTAAKLDRAWAEVEEALAARLAALKEFLAALKSLGLVPEARKELEEVVDSLPHAQAEGPRALAHADDRLRVALRAAYNGLPRERPERLREAQNRLAEAEDELDIVRRRYNQLAVDWNVYLGRTWPRFLARRRGFERVEPYLLPSQEEEFIRQHGPVVR